MFTCRRHAQEGSPNRVTLSSAPGSRADRQPQAVANLRAQEVRDHSAGVVVAKSCVRRWRRHESRELKRRRELCARLLTLNFNVPGDVLPA